MSTKVISAKKLHTMLNVTINYEAWIEDVKEYGFEEGFDFVDVQGDTVLSLDMATSICIIARSPQATKIKEAIEAAA